MKDFTYWLPYMTMTYTLKPKPWYKYFYITFPLYLKSWKIWFGYFLIFCRKKGVLNTLLDLEKVSIFMIKRLKHYIRKVEKNE